ncbi:hypothetical protein IWX64_002991 [Arthrobacter sp. CAN_A212]|uniref:hypothetical protein n=1 Tax=Arthrobacter sp. CAN_A212 TaxID=2787719 RepID=UPI0018CB3126
MTKSRWFVEVDFIFSLALAEDVEFDVLDALEKYQALFVISRDRLTGGISFSLQAHSAQEAVASLNDVLEPVHSLLGGLHVSKIDVMDERTRQTESGTPTFPELVGYIEIAHMANVSRQRARQLSTLEGFPVPVVETAAGPLRVKAAVEDWLMSWDRSPGRPRRVLTSN